MSELAFDHSGEPFDLPAAAAGWQVRRARPRGGPETLYDPQGLPLVLPITAGIKDLRRAVGREGSYLLAPVDANRRRIHDARTGYVSLNVPGLLEASGLDAARPPFGEVLALARVSTEQAQALVRLASVLLDTADALLRTAKDTQDAVQAIRDLMK
jgi:hypothetical protein